MNYLLIMGFLLVIPAVVSNYIAPFTGLFGKPDGKPVDRAVLVWVVFGFCAWLAHTNYGNSHDRLEACEEIARLTGEIYLDVCFERERDNNF